MIDGYETNPFKIERGLPQGDTASPYLFILDLEILLLRMIFFCSHFILLFYPPVLLLKYTIAPFPLTPSSPHGQLPHVFPEPLSPLP